MWLGFLHMSNNVLYIYKAPLWFEEEMLSIQLQQNYANNYMTCVMKMTINFQTNMLHLQDEK